MEWAVCSDGCMESFDTVDDSGCAVWVANDEQGKWMQLVSNLLQAVLVGEH